MRLYLSNLGADYTPPTKRGTWSISTATGVGKLASTPGGAVGAVSAAETSATNPTTVLVCRWVSDPVVTAGTLGGVIKMMIAVMASVAAMNATTRLHIYATAGSTDTVRGTLLATTNGGGGLWTTTASGNDTGVFALTPVALSVGDRIVVEIGYSAANAVTTSYTGSIYCGGTVTTELNTGAGGAATNPAWIDFSGADALFRTPATSTTPTPTYNSEATAATVANAAGSLAVGVPTGTVNGDFLLLAAGNSWPTGSVMTGFTKLGEANSGDDVEGSLGSRTAASEPASYTLSLTGAPGSTTLIAAIMRILGVSSVREWAMTPAADDTARTGSAISPPPPQLTLVQSTDLVVHVFIYGNDVANTATLTASVYAANGWTQKVLTTSDPAGSGSWGCGIGIFTKVGALDHPLVQLSAACQWTMFTMALVGAAAGPEPGRMLLSAA